MSERDMERMVAETAQFMQNRYFGKYRGLVADVDDPENIGRIKATVPEIYAEQQSPWAFPSVPFAGAGHGLVVLPEVGDGVWIEFEAGDPSRPIWAGTWWASGEMPDPGAKDTRVLVTSAGHKLILDDAGSKFQMLHSGGPEITMTNTDITLKVGAMQIVISNTGVSINNGAFEVR